MIEKACFLAAVLMLSQSAKADDPDTEIAKRHFDAGIELYDANKYVEAIVEFEAARQVKPLPAFDFNIGRCHDRLEHAQEAAEAYERYLNGVPDDKDAAEIKERIIVLRARLPKVSPVSTVTLLPATTPPRRSLTPPAILAASSLTLAITSAALLGQAHVDYNRFESSCAPMCDRSLWTSTQNMERAGWALIGIAGAAVIVDVVLWIRARRR